MINLPSILSANMNTDENIVYNTQSNFTVQGAGLSFIGTQTLYVTNKSRIYIHDTGGLFKGDTLVVYDAKRTPVEFSSTFDKLGVVTVKGNKIPTIFVNSKNFKNIYCDLEMKFELFEFIRIRDSQVDTNWSLGDEKSFVILENKYSLYSENFTGEIESLGDKVLINLNESIEISIPDISNVYLENGILVMEGIFVDDSKKIFDKIKIYNNDARQIENALRQVNFIKSQLDPRNFICYGKVIGIINGEFYNEKEVLLMNDNFNNKIFIVDKEERSTIIALNKKECEKLNEFNNEVILIHENLVLNLCIDDSHYSNLGILDLEDYIDDNIGIGIDRTPFFIDHSSDGVVFNGSENTEYIRFANEEIKTINFLSKYETVYFSKIEILANQRKEFYISEEMVKEMIKNIFMYSNYDKYMEMDISQIFDIWSQELKALLSYNMFSDYYYMSVFKDLVEEDLDSDKVFSEINTFNDFLDEAKEKSRNIYKDIPKIIRTQEKKLFSQLNIELEDDIFVNLEKKLFSVIKEMKNNLIHVDNTLLGISECFYCEELIIPEEKMNLYVKIAINQYLDFYLEINEYRNKFLEAIDEVLSYLKRKYLELKDANINEVLFERIADIHTFKQMPDGSQSKILKIIEDMEDEFESNFLDECNDDDDDDYSHFMKY